MIPAGKGLPQVYSDSFGNAEDNQSAIRITIVQKDSSGSEQIVVADIDKLPPRPKGKLNVIVTITVDTNKQLRLKATVPETAYIKNFGPSPSIDATTRRRLLRRKGRRRNRRSVPVLLNDAGLHVVYVAER